MTLDLIFGVKSFTMRPRRHQRNGVSRNVGLFAEMMAHPMCQTSLVSGTSSRRGV